MYDSLPFKPAIARTERAQAMVEFALALPIFLLLVYGLLEAGRAVFIVQAVTTAAKEGARFASASGVDNAGTLNYNNCAAIRSAAKSVGFLLNLGDNNIRIYYDDETPPRTPPLPSPPNSPWVQYCTPGTAIDTSVVPASGDRVALVVGYQFVPIVPLVKFTSYPVSASSSRTITGTIDLNTP